MAGKKNRVIKPTSIKSPFRPVVEINQEFTNLCTQIGHKRHLLMTIPSQIEALEEKLLKLDQEHDRAMSWALANPQATTGFVQEQQRAPVEVSQ